VVTSFCGSSGSNAHREELAWFEWWSLPAVGAFGGRRLAPGVSAASHELEESLGPGGLTK
jgi:hypothetical protein